MALGRELAQLVDEEVDLGRRRLARVDLVDEDRVERELAQPGEGRQDRDAVGIRVVEQAEHPLPLALQVLVVDVPVHRVRVEGHDLDLLGWQVDRDLLLGAPQHERADAAAQQVEQLGPLAGLDGLAVVLREDVGTGVEAGGREREQRPEVHEGVLERRAGDGNGERCAEPTYREVRLGLPVLDELRFVEHDPAPPHRVEGGVVEAQHGIRRDDDLGPGDLLGEGHAPLALGRGHGDRRNADLYGKMQPFASVV